jgi:hypothetical protein
MQFIISYQHVDMLLEYAMKIDTIIISNYDGLEHLQQEIVYLRPII